MKKKSINKTTTMTKGYLCLLMFMMIALTGFSQSVGISSNGSTPPNVVAGLDINFSNKGLLLPRVALESTTSFVPMTGHVAGMIVYNNATVGDVSPGYYFDNGSKWIPFFAKASSSGDIQYWDGTNWVNIPVGITGQTLQINGSGIPSWGTGVVPGLNTKQPTAITSSSATCGGILLNDGGSAITVYGVCWATTSAPTTGSSLTTDGSGIGSFSSSITGLSTGTVYYVRAYATTNNGTTYGNELKFTTP